MKVLTNVSLILLAVEDLRTQKIPFWLLVGLIIVSTIYGISHFPFEQCLLSVLPGVLLLVLAWMQREVLGIGDGLVAVAYGALLGWEKTCMWLMLSFLLVGVVGLFWKVLSKRRKLCLPLIPFMAVVHMGMSL